MTTARAINSERNTNIGSRLSEVARDMPEATAIVMPAGRDSRGRRQYTNVTFRELEEDSNRLATGLVELGVRPGTRLVLMVRPGIDFVSLTFALFKAGAVTVLIDPGMGLTRMVKCLEEAQPEGFVAIPGAQAVRMVLRHRFRRARFNVTVGNRWIMGGPTTRQLRACRDGEFAPLATGPDDPAAIIFTTGSTGPPKGVLYRHGNFDRQVTEIRDFYGIRPGEIDLPGFPLFGLFNSAMGVTTVIPDMDPTRPARVDPRNIVEAVQDWNVTQAFGSPAIWNVVGRYCEKNQIRLPSLKRVLSAGAPVPPHVLQSMMRVIADDGQIHTPYGATEALPVASISANEVLVDTVARSAEGAGTCVGRRFPGITWKVIRAVDGPIASIDQAEGLPDGQIGELVVNGPVVTREYATRTHFNATAKIPEGDDVWHRMGDVGYLDSDGRFWFCGRKDHRVLTSAGPMYTVCCEAIFNRHPRVYRSALVAVGSPGEHTPVIIVELRDHQSSRTKPQQRSLREELAQLAATSELTTMIPSSRILIHHSFPVDIRHNAKIFREKLAVWAERELGRLNG